MSYRVEIVKRAEQSAREVVRWIAEDAPEKATLWYLDFLEAAESLEAFPARCAIIPENEGQPVFRHLNIESFFGLKMRRFTSFTFDTKNKSRSMSKIFKP